MFRLVAPRSGRCVASAGRCSIPARSPASATASVDHVFESSPWQRGWHDALLASRDSLHDVRSVGRGQPRALHQSGMPAIVHPSPSVSGPLAQQVRGFAGKRSRTGRLQHFKFGPDRAKGKYYYRFHKLIGKWNWRKYMERFVAPSRLENRQRWIPSTYADYQMMRQSYSWHWRLPRELAVATTPDQVLETFIKFRHKQKQTYHYFKVLQRLVEVGGCDSTDWRLRFITSRLHFLHRKVINLPRLAHLYARLNVTKEMEHMCRFLYVLLPKYEPKQLAQLAHSFGLVALQDKRLMADIAKLLEPQLAVLSPTELVQVTQAFAKLQISHYHFLSRISAQVQVRVQQASIGEAPPGSCPTFAQLAEMAEPFAKLKFQDYSYFEMCALQAEQMLEAGVVGPTPPALARLCSASARLKINELTLYEAVLAHIADHWYDYPATCMAEIGAAVAPVMPQSEEVQAVYSRMLEVIRANRDTLTLGGVDAAARFMIEADRKGELAPGMSQALKGRLLELRDENREIYDVAGVVQIFAKRHPEDTAIFSCLCKHMHRHLGFFEPVDFVRFARGLASTAYRDDRVTHAMTKWAHKRLPEFSSLHWHRFISALSALGARESSIERLREVGPVLPEGVSQEWLTAGLPAS
eukprot:TRINITY_DN59509_c0_g1_i1.p1 TRINITY_DN59509_c0_g1~~TRINITY_DN59509_c0_g1_i1.p1  ORF type:complete len:638 (-),score=62.33 TRINITY_DN59509_c0_g1_i1:110-2023(-)